MSKTSKGTKNQIIFTLASTVPLLAIPLTTASVSIIDERVYKFVPDRIVNVNSEVQHKKEYEILQPSFFGYAHYKQKTMPNDQTAKLVKFIKTPTEDEWNQEEQTWTLMFETGPLDKEYYQKGTWWHNEYPFGQRVYGFALSDDLELIPGTVSVKFENAGSEKEISDVNAIDENIRRKTKYGIQGEPFANGKGKYYDENQNWSNQKYGAYVRFTDKYGNFDQSAEQTFSTNIPHDNKDDYVQITQSINTQDGTFSKGDLFTDFNNDPNAPEPMHIYTIPRYSGFDDSGYLMYLPGINGVEYITSDVAFRNAQKSFTPAEINDALSRTKTTDDKMPRRIFGIGIGNLLSVHSDMYNRANGGYNPFYNNVGSAFLIHYQTGLEKNRYDGNLRPIPIVTMQFKTRRKYTDVLTNSDDTTFSQVKSKVNPYLNKGNIYSNEKTFVAGLFHSDKYNDKGHENVWKQNSSNVDLNPSALGYSENQYTGVAFQFANRTANRSINIELTEKFEDTFDPKKKDQFPEITGYKIKYKGKNAVDDQVIDQFDIPWQENKNSEENLKSHTYRLLLNDFKLNTELVDDFENITIEPIIKNVEDKYKWTVSSTGLKLKPINNRFEVELKYKPSAEFIAEVGEETTKLNKLKLDLINEIDSNQYLNQAPEFVVKAKNEINKATQFSQLDGLDKAIIAMSDAVRKVSERIEKFEKEKETDVYKKSDDKTKTQLNEVIKDSKDLITSRVANSKIDSNFLKRLASYVASRTGAINEAYAGLSYWKDIASEIEKAKEHIDGLENIANNVKDEYKNKLNNLVNISDINQVTENADNFDSKITEIKTDLNQYKTFTSSNDFEKTSQILKDRYNNRISELDKMFSDSKANQSNLTSYSDLIDDLSETKEKILKWNLEALKTEAKEKIQNAKILNDKQKGSLTQQINKLTTETEIKQTSDNIISLVDNFDGLDTNVKDGEKLKTTAKYLEADSNRKEDFDTTITNAKNLLDEFKKNDNLEDSNTVDQFLIKVSTAADDLSKKSKALNGIQKVLARVQEIRKKIKTFNNLTPTLQNTIILDLNAAQTLEGLNEKEKAAENLNIAAGKFIEKVNEFKNLKMSSDSNFIEAGIRTQLDSLLTNSEQLLQTINDNEHSSLKLNVNDLEEVKDLTNKLDTNITIAKAPISTLKEQLSNALKVADYDNKDTKSQYFYASDLKQNEYNEALSKAQELLNKVVDNSNATTVSSKISALNTAVSSLDGHKQITSKLNEDKYQYLPQQIKNNVLDLIQKQNSKTDADVIFDKASDLSTIYDSFNKAVTNYKEPYVNNYSSYTEASDAIKKDYSNIASTYTTKENEINSTAIDDKNTLDSINKQIKELSKDFKNKYEALDGINNLKEEVKRLDQYVTESNYLSNGYKSNYKNSVISFYNEIPNNSTLTVASIKGRKTVVTNLENAVKSVNESLKQLDDLTKDPKYNKATNQTRQLVTLAKNETAKLIQDNKALATLVDPSQASDLITNRISPVLKAINKDFDDWSEYKNNKTQYVNNLSDLSSKQKEVLVTQIEATNTISEIDQIAKKADTLNTEMNNLSTAVAKAKEAKATDNYINSEDNIKQAFDSFYESKAIDNWTKENETSIDSQTIADLTNEINTKINSLNGKEYLEKVRKDSLTKLSDAAYDKFSSTYKNQLKQKINKATKVSELKNIIKDADATKDLVNGILTKFNKLEEIKKTDVYESLDNKIKQDAEALRDKHFKSFFGSGNLKGGAAQENLKELDKEYDDILKLIDKSSNDLKNELNDLKSKANQNISNLYPYLSKVQIQKVSNSINTSKTKTELESAVDDANKLNEAMKTLAETITKAVNIKDDNQYLMASPNLKSTFDSLVTSDKLAKLSKEKWDSIKLADVTSKSKAIQDAMDNLDGIANFNKLKTDSKNAIEQLGLSKEQKDIFKNKIDSFNKASEIEEVTKIAKQLDQAIKDLNRSIESNKNKKETVNYKEASKTPKESFDSQISIASTKLNEIKGDNDLSTNDKVSKLIKSLNDEKTNLDNAEKQLDGQTNLTNKINEAKGEIDKLSNLSTQVQQSIKDTISQKQSSADVNEEITKAQELNKTVEKLNQTVDSANKLKENDTFKFATPEQKRQFIQSLNEANRLLQDKKLSTSTTKEDIEAKNTALVDVANAITNEAAKIQAKIKKVQTDISSLTNLTQAQKYTLKDEVANKTNDNDIDALSTKANELDDATKELKKAIESASAIDKKDTNYKLADPSKQESFNNAKSSADEAYKNLGNSTKEQIDKLRDQLNKALTELNGNDNLANAKKQALPNVEKLNNLSDEFKNLIKTAINSGNNLDDISNIASNAKTLDETLKDAKLAKENAEKAQKTANYLDSDINNKDALDNALQAQNVKLQEIAKTNTITPESLNLLNEGISKATKELNSVKETLNGDAKISSAKQKADEIITGSSNLSDAYKNTLKENLKNSTRLEDIKPINDKATELNQLANKLKEDLTSLETAQKSNDYQVAKNDTISKVDNALEQSQNLLENNLLKDNVTKLQINDALKAIEKAKESIAADKTNFDADRKSKENEIDKLSSLSETQKSSLKNELSQALNETEVSKTLDKASKLDKAMQSLAAEVQKANETKSTNKYQLADKNFKDQFDKVADVQTLDNLSKDNQTSISPEEINNKANTLNNAIEALNGDDNFIKDKNAAKEAINNTSLSQNQKNKLNELINDANSKEVVDKITKQANDLATLINDLNQSIKQANQELNTPNYTEATTGDNQVKDLFDKQLAKSTENLNNAKKNNELTNTTVIGDLIKDLNKSKSDLEATKSNLDGQNKLNESKKAAKEAISQLLNLSPANITSIIENVDKKDTIQEINDLKDTATKLNTSANELINKLKEANDLVKDTSKYPFATPTQQSELTKEINKAQEMLDDQKLKPNYTSQTVEKVVNDLSKAINEINGLAEGVKEHIDQAKKDIDLLSNLTNEQKDYLKSKVASKTTESDINNVVSNAKEIDKATKEFKEVLEKAKLINKDDNNYKLSDSNKQSEFDSQLKKSIEALKDLSSKSKEEIEKLKSDLNNALEALDGDNVLKTKQDNAKADIEKLDKLSSEQKAVIKTAIEKANEPSDINNLTEAASELNKSISKAEELNKTVDATKTNPNYTQAANKTNFDSAVTKLADTTLNAKQSNDLGSVDKIKAIALDLNNKSKDFEDAVKALNGTELINQTKKEAAKQIDELEHLSDDAKTSIKNKINDDKINKIIDVSLMLDSAMQLDSNAEELLETINDLTDLNKTNKVDDLDQETKESIINDLKEANKLFTNNKLNDNLTITDISNTKDKLDSLIETINDNNTSLDEYKKSQKELLNNLTNLSNAQKQALESEIQNSTTKSGVSAMITKANELDKSMNKLANDLDNLKKNINSVNSKLASDDPKTAFNNLTTEKSLQDNSKDNISIIDKDQIEGKILTIENALKNLDGNSNLESAKEEISKLNNLPTDSKDSILKELNKANNKQALDNLVSNSKLINTTVGLLDNKLPELNKLISRFEPAVTNQNLSPVTDLLDEIKSQKSILDNTKSKIENIKNAKTLDVSTVENAKSNLEKAIGDANSIIDKVNNQVSNEIQGVKPSDIKDKEIKELVSTKLKELENDQINLNTALDNARLIQSSPYLDKYKDVIANAPEKLKASPAWNNYSIGTVAKNEIKNATTAEDDKNILDKFKHQLEKENLAYSYDQLNDTAVSNPKTKAKMLQELDKAKKLLDFNNNSNKEEYTNESEKLNWIKTFVELENLVKKVNDEVAKPFSTALAKEINKANDLISIMDSDVHTQKELQDAIDKINYLVDIEPLSKVVDKANDLDNVIKNKIKTDDSESLKNNLTKLGKLINDANKSIDSNKLDKSSASKKASELQNDLNTISNDISNINELLEQNIAIAEDLIPQSNELAKAIKEAKLLNKNSLYSEIEKAINTLQQRINTNLLDIELEKAPNIKDGEYKKSTPNRKPINKAISDNPKSTVKQIFEAVNSQKLNNAQIKAINGVYDYNNLNKAQKDKFVSEVGSSTNVLDIDELIKNAAQLNKAMELLKKAYDGIDSKYKQNPINVSEFIHSTKAEQESLQKLLNDAKNLLIGDGTIYLNNNAQQVDKLVSDIQNKIANLSGINKAQNDLSKIKYLSEAISKLENTDSNKIFNSPKALKDTFNNNLDEIKRLNELSNNPIEFNANGGVDKLEQLVQKTQNLANEVDKFSSNSFKDVDNNTITQAQDFINKNSDSLNNPFINNKIDEYNKQLTYANAIDKLSEIKTQNNKASEEINKLQTILKDMLDKADTQGLKEVTNNLNQIKDYVNEAKYLDLDSVVKQLPNLVKLANKLNKLLNSSADKFKFNSDLLTLIAQANKIPEFKAKSLNDLITSFNDKLHSIQTNSQALKDVLEAIKSNDIAKLEAVKTKFDKSLSDNNKFVQYLIDVKYPLLPDDNNVLEQITKSNEYQKASKALTSLIKEPKAINSSSILIWPWLTAIAAITFLGGIIGINKSKKSKK
ncbi:hypothetical protein SAM46_01560 [Mycoplasmopsis verecunda]|uniref:hypothetical protein n=1 Tax=Mycoplasmopsis verecunda TaxID=171291 RepID=UPI00298D068F|nr:hypothetical protein [Mycoplasmopsis verecunda]WPB54823.1 hypothetical protein SAM46_01560 [Mycoplasmopsis verecunda]